MSKAWKTTDRISKGSVLHHVYLIFVKTNRRAGYDIVVITTSGYTVNTGKCLNTSEKYEEEEDWRKRNMNYTEKRLKCFDLYQVTILKKLSQSFAKILSIVLIAHALQRG